MQRVILLLLAVVAATSPPLQGTVRSQWEDFKRTYNKTYKSSAEELARSQIFAKKIIEIAKHNEKYANGLVSFSRGINHLSDLHPEEFSNVQGCSVEHLLGNNYSTFKPPTGVKIPEAIDWRPKGLVTPVKNQLMCGSCWAFSATGSLEGQHFLKTGKLVSLSEQNLIDCSKAYKNNGCKNGTVTNAFNYIKNNGGIDTEQSYPYEAKDGACRFKKEHVGATVTGFMRIRKGSEEDLKKAVATKGPVSVSIDAHHGYFTDYKTGVMDGHCNNTVPTHGVLVVGYGKQNGKKYWIIKNSWGTDWGQGGYGYMIRDKNNHCGIANYGIIPLV